MSLRPRFYEDIVADVEAQKREQREREANSSTQLIKSKAQLSLESCLQQTQPGPSKQDGAKPAESAVTGSAKGKPRLLLMGQRR